eukprot:m.1565889 g.1565889  ORF g.1565889 m.1565889 type:complete len:89 (+) comp25288_c1_seq19:5016-5282(+)
MVSPSNMYVILLLGACGKFYFEARVTQQRRVQPHSFNFGYTHRILANGNPPALDKYCCTQSVKTPAPASCCEARASHSLRGAATLNWR